MEIVTLLTIGGYRPNNIVASVSFYFFPDLVVHYNLLKEIFGLCRDEYKDLFLHALLCRGRFQVIRL